MSDVTVALEGDAKEAGVPSRELGGVWGQRGGRGREGDDRVGLEAEADEAPATTIDGANDGGAVTEAEGEEGGGGGGNIDKGVLVLGGLLGVALVVVVGGPEDAGEVGAEAIFDGGSWGDGRGGCEGGGRGTCSVCSGGGRGGGDAPGEGSSERLEAEGLE